MKKRVAKRIARKHHSIAGRPPGTWRHSTFSQAHGRIIDDEKKYTVKHPQYGSGWVRSIDTSTAGGPWLHVEFQHETRWVSADSVTWRKRRRRSHR